MIMIVMKIGLYDFAISETDTDSSIGSKYFIFIGCNCNRLAKITTKQLLTPNIEACLSQQNNVYEALKLVQTMQIKCKQIVSINSLMLSRTQSHDLWNSLVELTQGHKVRRDTLICLLRYYHKS